MSSRFIMPFADVGSGIKPSSGAKLFFFELDGVTPKNTFSDQLSTPTANTNPVISDSNGVFGDIYIDGTYKVTLQNKNGTQIFGGAIVDDPTSDLINDLSQAYEFATVAEYKAFATAFPVGKVINLLDRGASFTVISGTGTATGNKIIGSDQVSQSITLTVGLVIKPHQWGAIDGADNTEVLQEISNDVVSNTTIDLGDIEYVISATGTPTSPFGHRVFDLDDKDGVSIIGDRARVTVVNHDVSINGGLSFAWAKACNGLEVSGIDFDMSFTGVYTGSTQYPQCGGIIGSDGSDAEAGGSRTQDELNGNWLIKDNTFKLFHPFGQYAQSGSAYLGDPNNGFKIFPLFVQGAFDAVDYTNQPRKIVIDNCTLKEGGNSYGFWAWAWNDVTMTKCTAESFVGKQSNNVGVYSGVGEPMMRYHQFYCSGLKVINNYFRAKPCSDRLAMGFEGNSSFVHYNTNLNLDLSHGACTITGNNIITGRGDAANSASDWDLFLVAYGAISIIGNTWDSTSETTNASGSNVSVYWNAESKGSTAGNTTMSVVGNTFGVNCDYTNNITISNGSATEAGRRLKQLVVEGNTSLGQAQYFVQMSATSTFYGVQDIKISNNIINGEFNTLWDSANSNSRAIEVSASEATDMIDVSKNTIRGKFYGIETNSTTVRFTADWNAFINVSTRWLGTIPTVSEREVGAPTYSPADGSFHTDITGAVGATLYARQSGAWTLIG